LIVLFAGERTIGVYLSFDMGRNLVGGPQERIPRPDFESEFSSKEVVSVREESYRLANALVTICRNGNIVEATHGTLVDLSVRN